MTALRKQLRRKKREKARKPPPREMQFSEFKEMLKRALVEPLSTDDVDKLSGAMDTLAFLTRELEAKGTSIKRLRKMIFGPSTEKTSHVIGESAAETAETPSPSSDAASSGDPSSAQSADSSDDTAQTDGVPPTSDSTPGKDEPKRKGHGRNGAAAYTGAKKVTVPLESLEAKQCCPGCQRGKLYPMTPPAQLVRVTGMAPLMATVYELERLRCNLCGEVLTAPSPPGVGDKKYDETAASMIALLKYGTGLPFHRIERLEGGLGIPLPASTQWEVAERAASLVTPAYAQLVHEAAQGHVLYNDDTTARVLELDNPQRREQLDEDDELEGRTGVFTSGIVATSDGRQIALFFTGQKHAGENLSDLLAQRATELPTPIQMCDALSRNLPGDFETLLANCNAHARRKFVDVADNFETEVRFVIETLRTVYHHDAIAKERALTPQERLSYHQTESAPLMAALHTWCNEQLEQHLVELNGGLGKAIAYMLKHWHKLTLFLTVAGAPLDNNLCERALKKAILHRKSALFYKTLNGARVGDLFMSLIYTAELAKVNVFDYLVALQRHHEDVADNPAAWMPWNYAKTQAALPC